MIYLDNAATTHLREEVVRAVGESMRADFANPGAVYKIGLDARNRIEEARESIAKSLDVPGNYQIVFTSGGSESNNLFIKGYCRDDKRSVACSGLEHPSILETVSYLGGVGLDSHVFSRETSADPLSLSGIAGLARENNVRLLCLSHVNNETGAVCDSETALSLLARESPKTKLFLDGVQAVGRIPVCIGRWAGLSGYSVSGHKIGGPKGIGLLIYDSRLKLTPQIHGGRQQGGIRSGTLPVPLIVGLAKAIEMAVSEQGQSHRQATHLRARLISGLEKIAGRDGDFNFRINTSAADNPALQSPFILNFSFPPVEGEVVLHHLERDGIYVGLGSACSAHSKEPSRILKAMGLTDEEGRCSLRVSLGPQNTEADVDRFLDRFAAAYRELHPAFSARKKKKKAVLQ